MLIPPMKIKAITLHPYEMPLRAAEMRAGLFLNLIDELGNSGWGEVAPLPKWSRETLEEARKELEQKQPEILRVDWTARHCLKEIDKLHLLPSVSFGLESALLSILSPVPQPIVRTSALFMGSPEEMMKEAELRYREGYSSAKLKVGHLSFEKAAEVIHKLKDKFNLRIDVNRAWSTKDSLQFFNQFPLETFDYVEEPFQNPHELALFPHPLAVDESFPEKLSLPELETFPMLKALIYKPTIQGGLLGCLSLRDWTEKRGVDLVLSSSFETDLGLAHVASIAHRLSLSSPVGIGTYHYLSKHICVPSLRFSHSFVRIPGQIEPKLEEAVKSKL